MLILTKKVVATLHMLRSEIGDNDFRKMLYAYLDIYKNQSVETTNFLNIVEDISGKSLHRFFDQWIYGSGNPRLDIEFYLEHDMNKKKIRIRSLKSSNKERLPNGMVVVLKKIMVSWNKPGFIRFV